jgi:hypothetical protein
VGNTHSSYSTLEDSETGENDEKNEEEEWRQEWMNRICPDGKPSLLSPLDQISVFTGFLDDIFGRKRWSPRAKR